MKVRNRTAFPFAPLLGRVNFPHFSVTCTVRGTFTLKPGALLEPLAEQPPYAGDEPSKAERPECLYAADLAPFKPRADLLLRATCHNLRAATTCMVKFSVGGWAKELAVIGNRRWDKGMVFNKMGEPEAFNTVELTWANAFGGEGFAPNPAGKGRKDGVLPNVEDPAELIKSPGNQPMPASFGPIDRTWKLRASKLGTYDKKWLKERWPAQPKDFDWTYHNAAPEDQQVDFLRGDEAIALQNMHPEHPDLRATLPGLRMRCLLRRAEEDGLSEHDVPMNLDTLYVDAQKMLVTLVWRGVCNIREEEGEDVVDALVWSEPLSAPPATIEQARPWLEDEPEEAEPYPGEAIDTQTSVMEGEALAEAMEAAAKAQIGALRSLVPAKYAATLGVAATAYSGFKEARAAVAGLIAKFTAAGKPAPAELAKLARDLDNDPNLLEAEADGYIAAAMAMMPAVAALKGPALAAAIRKGETPDRDFRGAELAGEDLSGADLSQADFTGAKLAGAVFTGCKLDDTQFCEADLGGANMAGVKAVRIDFTAANLEGADFTGAKLEAALFNRVKAAGAKFGKAELEGASFAEGTLGMDASGAMLKQADFSRAELSGSNFAGAELTEAVLNGARAENVSFKGARAAGLRGAEAVFKGCNFEEADAPGAIFEHADLAGANFRFAMLKGALFAGANLSSAVLFGAVVRQASLRKADMSGAQAGNADFFQCDFEKANLSGASLITSNCYEAAFRDAKTDGADFTETNLKMTLLA